MEREVRILVLCTGNSCRSQMAHGFLQSFDPNLQVFSAGTNPAEKVNPKAVVVMREVGVDTINEFRRVRDKIKDTFYKFYKENLE